MASSAVAADYPLRSVSTSWKDHLKSFVSVITSETIVEPTQPLTVDQLIRQRSKEEPSHAIVSYPSSGIEYVNYTYRQLDIFAARVAQKYAIVIPQRTSSLDPERVVGLLGLSNFDYLISILALTKLGHTVLFLSTRISVTAHTSLLQTTGANHILVDQGFRDTISQVKEGLPNIEVHDIISSKTYHFAIANQDFHTQFDSQYDPEVESSKIAWIIHSSGSTGLPKPIFQTHRAALSNYASNLNLRGFITLSLTLTLLNIQCNKRLKYVRIYRC